MSTIYSQEKRTLTIPFYQAQPQDAAEISALVNAAYAPWIDIIGQKPGPMMDDYAVRIAENYVGVLRIDGAIVAAIVLIEQPEALLLDNVAVHPRYHGKGLGRRLLSMAEEIGKWRGYSRLHLYAHEKMASNIALYERFGYVITKRVTERGLDRVYMEKTIRPHT